MKCPPSLSTHRSALRHLVVASSIVLVSLSQAKAAALVTWGPAGDIVTANQALVNGGGSSAISFSAFSSPAVGANYYPNSTGATPSFYSAGYYYEVTTANPGGIIGNPTRAVSNGASLDTNLLTRNFNQAGTSAAELHGIYMWRKNEFLSGGNSADSVTLDGMSMTRTKNAAAIVANVRFVVQLDTAYYVSQEFIPVGNNGTVSFANPTSISWFNYNPTSNFTTIGSSASLTAADFEDLNAAGYYLYGAQTVFGSVQMAATAFSVTGTPVPEPSAVALATLGLGVFLWRRRSRRIG